MVLLVKLNDETIVKVISKTQENLIPFDIREEQIDYSANTKLEEEQCFKIEKFTSKEFCPEFLKTSFATAGLPQWYKEKNIKYFLNTDESKFYFQKFIPSQILKKNWFAINDEPNLENREIITLQSLAHALYDKKLDTLFFYKLDDIKTIFSGIESLYREATKEETENFITNDLFESSKFDTNKIGKLNLKKIALHGKKITQLNNKKQFLTSLENYCSDIEVKNNKIIIKSNKDLTNILYHLDERFYTTKNTQEKRCANSIIEIKK